MSSDNYNRKKYLAEKRFRANNALHDLYDEIPKKNGLNVLKESKLKIDCGGPNDRDWKIEIQAPIGDVMRVLKYLGLGKRIGELIEERQWRKEEKFLKEL